MILDHLNNLKRYNFPQTDKILDFIAQNDCVNLPNEQINIDGENLFVRVMEYEPKPDDQNKFENHRVYADLQLVVRGVEIMQVVASKHLTTTTEYDPQGDYQFFQAQEEITNLVLTAGQFAVFYPTEAHKPACLFKNYKVLVKKLVFKIKLN